MLKLSEKCWINPEHVVLVDEVPALGRDVPELKVTFDDGHRYTFTSEEDAALRRWLDKNSEVW
jgi:hypothetical protein